MVNNPFQLEIISDNGPPLLLIGGVNTRLRHWQPYVDAFEHTHSVLCLSLKDNLAYPLPKPTEKDLENALKDTLKPWLSTRLNIITFSMGSRIAFYLLSNKVYTFDKVLIVAPDGIKKHPVFEFATTTLCGHWLFDQTIKHLSVLFYITRGLKTLGLVDNIIVNLLKKLSADKSASRQLYNYWMIYCKFKINWTSINVLKSVNKTQLQFLFGQKDIFISSLLANEVKKNCPEAIVAVLPIGHHIKDEKFLNYAKNFLTK